MSVWWFQLLWIWKILASWGDYSYIKKSKCFSHHEPDVELPMIFRLSGDLKAPNFLPSPWGRSHVASLAEKDVDKSESKKCHVYTNILYKSIQLFQTVLIIFRSWLLQVATHVSEIEMSDAGICIVLTHPNIHWIWTWVPQPPFFYTESTWKFPKVGLPQSHPLFVGTFHYHPAIGGSPILGTYTMIS